MNYKKVLEQMGLIEGVDFSLTENLFEMLPKIRRASTGEFIHHEEIPAVYEDVEVSPLIEATYDEEGIELTPEIPAVIESRLVSPLIESWEEEIFEDENYIPDSPTQEILNSAWQEVQLKELDIVDLINLYLQDKAELKNENDHINIVNGLIYTWSYANIPQPTLDELVTLIPTVQANVAIETLIKNKADIGKKFREDCDLCLDLITGFNDGNNLSAVQIQQMLSTFANINAALSNRMPKTAKTLLIAVVPDGVVVTQEMKDMVLEVLKDYPTV